MIAGVLTPLCNVMQCCGIGGLYKQATLDPGSCMWGPLQGWAHRWSWQFGFWIERAISSYQVHELGSESLVSDRLMDIHF
jgi:hypothetical protein